MISGVSMLFGNYVNIGKQHLDKYCCSIGGGMSGGYCRKAVKRLDGAHALITIEKAEWHNQEPETEEYPVDISIMDELEAVIRKYRMNFWHRKKFTNMFVNDGESKGYTFEFDKKTVRFSSQIYPQRYRNKLREFDDIIGKYISDVKAV